MWLRFTNRKSSDRRRVCTEPSPAMRAAVRTLMGVARIFQGGGGGHTLSNRVYSRFRNLNIVGCLSKKRLTRGGGHGHPRTPPGYALDCAILSIIFPLTGNGAFLCVQDVVVDLPWRKDANKVFFREVNANK